VSLLFAVTLEEIRVTTTGMAAGKRKGKGNFSESRARISVLCQRERRDLMLNG
jgi:hypothetical protein